MHSILENILLIMGQVRHSGVDRLGTELKTHEKNLYPAVENFLKTQKNCIAEYVGSELFLKRGKTSLRAEGVWSIK
jgi:hypothetical protein